MLGILMAIFMVVTTSMIAPISGQTIDSHDENKTNAATETEKIYECDCSKKNSFNWNPTYEKNDDCSCHKITK